MIRLIITYLATALAFAAVDFIWLTQFGPKLYHPTLDPILRPANDPVDLPAAVVFYLVYIVGVLALAVWPKRNEPLLQTTITGAMLGAMCYATFDLTSQATFKVWSTQISLVDITWGIFITAFGATVGGFVLKRLTPKT
jgi:uncharacterized membrane protein